MSFQLLGTIHVYYAQSYSRMIYYSIYNSYSIDWSADVGQGISRALLPKCARVKSRLSGGAYWYRQNATSYG